MLETLAAAAICAMHLSRFAEELVIWCSAQFGFVQLSDKFTTGSSIMPQKRNPDAAELVRAKIGRIIGALTALLVVMKGLPLAYSKDMQEDKEVAFDALDSLSLALAAMTGMVGDLEPNGEKMRRPPARGYSTATDLADWLVREADMPFREAHHITGANREARREEGRRPRPAHPGRDAKRRAGHYRSCARRAQCGKFRGEPAQLWGHSTRKCAGRRCGLAETSGCRSAIALRKARFRL